jgi:hypothetical protein
MTPSSLVCPPFDLLPHPRTPGAIRTDRHANQRKISEGIYGTGHPLFCNDVIATHPLPTRTRVAVQKSDSTPLRYGHVAHTIEVRRIEADIAMNLPVAFAGADNRIY